MRGIGIAFTVGAIPIALDDWYYETTPRLWLYLNLRGRQHGARIDQEVIFPIRPVTFPELG